MDKKNMDFESNFDIDKISFNNVNSDFEKDFRKAYRNSLENMSDAKDPLQNASGANTLGILEKMAQHIKDYDRESDFGESYEQLLKEYRPFTET
ncbi:MAG TPA: hypothetical protein VHT34_13100 [Clostridia bacterium]|nr:hypothetical protein [Clostridia bacterium]